MYVYMHIYIYADLFAVCTCLSVYTFYLLYLHVFTVSRALTQHEAKLKSL